MKKQRNGAARGLLAVLLAALLMLGCGAAALADAEEPASGEPAAQGSASDEPVVEDAILDEVAAEPTADGETPAEPALPERWGDLSAALLKTAGPELSALSDRQRAELVRIWTENDFHFADTAELVALYGGIGLSAETAFIVLLANADGCVGYVSDYYGGSLSVLAEFCESFVSLTDELAREGLDLTGAAGYARAMVLIDAAYQAMMEAGDEGALLDGCNYTNELVLSYGADHGAADAEAFLSLFAAEA